MLITMMTRACLMCRFNLQELRKACGDVADVEVEAPPQSTGKLVDGLAKISQDSDQVSDTESHNDGVDEAMSDAELEELCEFMLTQRQQNVETRDPRSVTMDDRLPSGKEAGSGSESDEDDVVHLSQALLRKLEESFAAEFVRDENGISSGAAEAEEADAEICDKLNDSIVSVDNSDHVMSAELSSSDTEVCVGEDVGDDVMDNQQTSVSAQQDSKICAIPEDSKISVSVDKSDQPTLVEQSGEDVEMNDVDCVVAEPPAFGTDVDNSYSVTKLPGSADDCEVEMISDDVVGDKPTSPEPAAEAAQSTCHSAPSPVHLFEESSLEQCDLERLNSGADKPASADDNRHLSDVDFVDVSELIDRCESSDDLFDSPTSNKSTASPVVGAHAPSETLSQQSGFTLRSSPVECLPIQSDSAVQHDSQTPLSSRTSAFSPVKNLQTQFEGLTERDTRTSLSRQKPSSARQENRDANSEVLAKEGAPEMEETDIVEVGEHLPDKPNSSEHRRIDSGEDGSASKRRGLRKVRAKTRNSLSSDDIDIVHYSPGVQRTLRCRSGRRSRQVETDVEPDSEDDVASSQAATSEKSLDSLRPSSRSGSASTKKCYVKLTRMNDADLPPQVELI